MALVSTALSYKKLKQEIWFNKEDNEDDIREKIIGGYLRKTRFRKGVHVQNKSRVTIPSLKKYLKRKSRLFRFGWNKVFKRLKNSGSQFGDIFARNSLLMQVSPTPDENGRALVHRNRDYLLGSPPSHPVARIF